MKVKSTLDAPPLDLRELALGAGDDELKRRIWGLFCRAACPLDGPEMRAPVSRPRPFSFRLGGLAVADRARRRPRPGGRARARRRASPVAGRPTPVRSPCGSGRRRGSRAGAASCAVSEGWPIGVVLLAREQTPEQARELARGGDDRDLVAAAGADALVEGVQRAGLADRAPARLDQRVARARRALLGDPPVAGRARCRTGGPSGPARDSRPACARSRKRRMSPTAARNVAAHDHVDPGHGHQPARPPAELSASRGDQPLDRRDLGVEELDLAQRRVDRLALLDRQLELGQPRAPLDPEQIGDRRRGRPAGASSTAWISFLARDARRHQLRAARQPPAHHPRALDRASTPLSSSPAANSLASVRASSRSVFARAWRIPVSLGRPRPPARRAAR